MADKVTIWHNPNCETSRNTLAMIRAAGIEPIVVEYLKAPPTRGKLAKAIADAGLTPKEAAREKGTPFAELALGEPGVSSDAILDAMLAHPILINRPFVFTKHGVRLCRPSEAVLEILPRLFEGDFTKENGEIISIETDA